MSWDEHAASWDESEAVRAYSRAAFSCLTALCAERELPLAGARILDFGCGTGLLTEQLAPRCSEIVAVDTSPKMIAVLRRKVQRLDLHNVRLSTTGIEPKSLDEEEHFVRPFDLVVCSSVCAFLDDYPATAATLAGLLRPGGLLAQWDWELEREAEESFGLTRAQVSAALTNAGLQSVKVETAFEVTVDGETMRPLMGTGQAPVLVTPAPRSPVA